MTTAILLSAGSSKRMGDSNKLLLSVGGTPMVSHIASVLLSSDIDQIIGVLGHQRNLTQALLKKLTIKTVYNPHHQLGMVGSIKAGISILPKGTARIMIALGDMPLMKAAHINSILKFSDKQAIGSIIRPITNSHEFGHPVIFAARYIDEIMNCIDAHSLKSVIKANKSAFTPFRTEDRAYFTDIDTPSEYKKLNI
ncbi:MAG: molybdenum cofactor cytidylyltransferase [Saprospiraceae bacterium]|jgi:molybdenum cofactor cytidylyltransferase